MRFLIFLLALLWPVSRLAAASLPDTLRGGHLAYSLDKPIPFHAGDNRAWASPAYDDRGWTLQSPVQRLLRKEDPQFPELSWWRLAFVADSTLAGKPLSITITETGASDVYLDGALLHRFDERPDRDSSATQGSEPFIFTAPAAGPHLLAIRYAQNVRGARRAGFVATISEANASVTEDREQTVFGIATLMTLCGLFLAFGVLHLMMFLYYRTVRSNLWFAFFSCLLASLFGLLAMKVGRLGDMDNSAFAKTMLVILSLACYSLSGLVNNLFFGRRTRWLRILLLGGLMLSLLLPRYGNMLIIGGIIAAAIEAAVILVLAVWRRRPGARIIASGMLLFIVLLIVVFAMVATIGVGHILVNIYVAAVAIILLAIAVISIPLSMSAYLAWHITTMSKSLKAQLAETERLSEETRRQEKERQRLLESRQEELEREVASRTEELRGQKQKSDDLLLNILPAEVAEELKERGAAAARQYDNVSVLFTDFADFTQRSETLTPEALIAELDECFRAFDGIIGRHGLEKIKTVGDAYIAVSGLPVANEHHAATTVRAALEIRDFMRARVEERPDTFHIRLGIHSGPVIAGIVGVKKFAYDIWGDTVNTAARMEQHSEAGRLNISAATYAIVQEAFRCVYRGELEAKHKGKLGMYFVEE